MDAGTRQMDDDKGIRKMNGAPIDGLSHPHPHDHATPLDQGSRS